VSDGDHSHTVDILWQVIFMTGWSPSRNTPKAAKRGSGTVSFAEMASELQSVGQWQAGLSQECRWRSQTAALKAAVVAAVAAAATATTTPPPESRDGPLAADFEAGMQSEVLYKQSPQPSRAAIVNM